jgi:Lar family restriction alleviation protein
MEVDMTDTPGYFTDSLGRIEGEMREELKPCPFCGSDEAALASVQVDPFGGRLHTRAVCPNCGAMGGIGWGASEDDEAAQEAEEEWNRRR